MDEQAGPRPDPPPSVAQQRPWRRWVALLAALAALLAALPLALWALLGSAAGSAWLLAQVPGLQVQQPRGALLGARFEAERLRWQGAAGRLDLRALAIEDLRLQWRPAPGLWLGLQAQAVRARRLHWQGADTPASPPPSTLRLPLALRSAVALDELQLGDGAPLHGLQAVLEIGAAGGSEHRVSDLRLRWDGGQASAELRLQADAPLALALQADLHSLPAASKPWQAQLRLQGPLASPTLQATLSGLDDSAHAEVQARLKPFAGFPLAALTLRTQDLDLARLSPRLPQTRIGGSADLVDATPGQALQLQVQLDNQRPGRWDAGRLPLRELRLVLRADPAAPDRVEIAALILALAGADGAEGTARDAGRLSGSGLWQGHELTLELQAAALQPQRLDARAPAWQLDGALGLQAGGLPSPDPAAAAATEPWQALLALALHGQPSGLDQTVFVQAQARASADVLQLERLLARSGAAQASADARLRRTAAGWAVAGQAALQDFDPAPWWPGLGAAWQRGRQRLNGRLALDLQLPLPADGAWRRISGSAELQLEDSLLADVPLSGHAALQTDGQLSLALDAGGNRIELAAQPDRGTGEDQARFTIAAPALERLAPWSALHPALQDLPRAGSLQADGSLQGRWPALRGQGQAQAKGVLAGALRLGEATLQWQTGSDAALQARLQVHALQWQRQTLADADLRLDGTLDSHRLRLDAALPLLPPPALARSLALGDAEGTRLGAQLSGRLQHDAEGWRWQGELQQLGAGPWDGRWPADASAPQAWLQAQPLHAELAFGRDGSLQRLRADAGRLRLAGGIALAWDELRQDAGSLRWQARLEDLAVAPLLARWQPAMGWEGDLRIGARLQLALGAQTEVEAVIERRGGDLAVRESPESVLALGLSDLRLALQASDGEWTFTQALAGSTLGELGGVLRAQTTPQARWPGADAVLDGSMVGRVAKLEVWGAWVPPGWRLQGSVASELHFGGRLGAPELRGSLDGDGLGLRNLLQGVHLRDGELRIRLAGERAEIDRFVLHAGEGRLQLGGGATLGLRPQADLTLQAERFQLLSRIDRRLVASGQARLVLAAQSLSLRGSLGIDEGLFDASRSDAPALDDDVVVRRADTPAAAAAGDAAPAPPRRTEVALDIDLGPRLRVRGHGLDTRLAGKLRISAPGGRLAVNGSVNTVDGSYNAYAQKLVVQRGELVFTGDPANPRLDVLALRPNLDIEVGVSITGGVQSPRVRLYANPELSDTDKLSWLVLGRDPGALGRTDSALLQRAAMALLAGEGETPSDTVLRNLGLDEFSVRQDEDGSGTRDTVVSLGKQISSRWYLGYERSMNATVGTWQLIYRVAQRFTLRAQSGAENALDAIWVWRVP